jgi:NAD(P)-dependent dehydrogenase (short-subunit alcohol dehydrogenase family)
MTAGGAVLITGGNSGIGKEVARQLAESDSVDSVYLACRNATKAEAARADLERTTGKSIFTTVPLDTSDLDSVRAAIDLIDTPLGALIMNAGGTGGATPMAKTKDGVTETFASNVLGHVVLLEELIAKGAVTSTAVLVGSEAARGVPKLGLKRPTFTDHSVAEFASVIDGSFFDGRKVDLPLTYCQVKYLGALWMSDLARRHPELRLLTVSPGNTAGTDVFRDMAGPMPMLMKRVLMPFVLPRFGLAHPVGSGARRVVDAVMDDALSSGVFYASAAKTLTGPLVDQASIVADFADPAIQSHANEAIHQFLG